MRKMRLGAKLIVIGTMIVVIPLAIVGFVAVNKSVNAITAIEYEQMTARSKSLAQMMDKVFEGEQ